MVIEQLSNNCQINCNLLKAWEKSHIQGAIIASKAKANNIIGFGFGFGFASHWLKNWHEIFEPIMKCSNCHRVTTQNKMV